MLEIALQRNDYFILVCIHFIIKCLEFRICEYVVLSCLLCRLYHDSITVQDADGSGIKCCHHRVKMCTNLYQSEAIK